jgi:queuosine precursor transporter
MKNWIKREREDYRVLLRSVPSLVVSLFVVSVIMMNLLANKELFTNDYLALDCGFTLSWVSFLCMDTLCKRFGGRAAAKISILAMTINLLACLVFKLLSFTPGMWGEYYSTGSLDVNNALNATFGGSWYVVFGSSLAMFVSSILNAKINSLLGRRLRNTSFRDFAIRSYVSTAIAQFVDNMIFAVVVSYHFFGWTPIQVVCSSIVGAGMELFCEVVFSPIGYKVSLEWEADNVGETYIEYRRRLEGK